jgi:hypothetical protein
VSTESPRFFRRAHENDQRPLATLLFSLGRFADNKLALNAGWDYDLLTLESKDLMVELDFDI